MIGKGCLLVTARTEALAEECASEQGTLDAALAVIPEATQGDVASYASFVLAMQKGNVGHAINDHWTSIQKAKAAVEAMGCQRPDVHKLFGKLPALRGRVASLALLAIILNKDVSLKTSPKRKGLLDNLSTVLRHVEADNLPVASWMTTVAAGLLAK